MLKPIASKLLLITPFFILFSHYLAVFPHEYAHSIVAWVLGYKTNPFDLNYGGTSIENIILLLHMDQNVDNKMIYALGHPNHVGFIALVGPLVNFLLFSLSFWLLRCRSIQERFYTFYFLFFFNLMNLGNIYDYVPIRSFVTKGYLVDILDIQNGFNLSPWWVYGIVGYLLTFLIWQFFARTLILTCANLNIKSTVFQAVLMMSCVFILFGYFAIPGFLSHEDVPFFISATSILAIPGIILVLWPTHAWVQRQFRAYEKMLNE